MYSVSITEIVFLTLADLMQFLRERSDQQKTIDEMAAQLAALTAGLQQSSAGLQEAVNKENQ